MRLHRVGDRTLSAEIVHLPVQLLGWLDAHDTRGSLYGMLERRGLLPVRASLEVRRASLAELDDALRPHFGNEPPVRLERVSYLPGGQPVEHLIFWYPHDVERWVLRAPFRGEER